MLKMIDLFAGAGGLSYGFEMTGKFEVIAAAELNPHARKTYIENHAGQENIKMVEDVRSCDFKSLSEELDGVDVVIGGPPCQGFSNANRQKNHIISMNNSLVKEYFRAIEEIRPKAFIMENVSMLSSDTHRFYDSYIDHERVANMGLEMRTDELVLAIENYHDYNTFELLSREENEEYRISIELFQLLNVLYKNRNNETRKNNYISKYVSKIMSDTKKYFDNGRIVYDILQEIYRDIEGGAFISYDELGKFLKYQKAFELKEELDRNQIIYELEKNPITGSVNARVSSYAVIDYVKNILGTDYIQNSGTINSLWFGVPQERRRYIVIGIRSDIAKNKCIQMPEGDITSNVTVGEALLDLMNYEVSIEAEKDKGIEYKDNSEELSDYAKIMRTGSKKVYNHIGPKTKETALKRFAALKEGENFHKLDDVLKTNYADPGRTQNSIYLRLDASRSSGTVVNVRKSMWIHPRIDRAISIREAARLQSFPDRFRFMGPKDSQYQQVGNAVPPLMAKGIAECLLAQI
jgi:DNA (cytosine-5)-methyltransferase 1